MTDPVSKSALRSVSSWAALAEAMADSTASGVISPSQSGDLLAAILADLSLGALEAASTFALADNEFLIQSINASGGSDSAGERHPNQYPKVKFDHTKPLDRGKVPNLRGLKPDGASIAARLAARIVELQKSGVLERFSVPSLRRIEAELDAAVSEQERAPANWQPSEVWDPARETALDHYHRVYASMPLKPTTQQMRNHEDTSALLAALAVAASRTKRRGGAWPRTLSDFFPGPGRRGRPKKPAPTSDEAVSLVMRRREDARTARSKLTPDNK